MILRTVVIVAASASLIGGCAMLSPSRGGEGIAGQVLRVETNKGQQSTLRFRNDGRVRASFGSNQVTGRWQLEGRRLCFFWTGAQRECWPYSAPFPRDRTVTVTSDRGNVVRVTRR